MIFQKNETESKFQFLNNQRQKSFKYLDKLMERKQPNLSEIYLPNRAVSYNVQFC